jgi:hypothetical protein
MRIEIHHYLHHVEDEGRLARIEALLTTLTTKGEAQMATLQELMAELQAEVTRNTEVDQSAILLINGLADQIAALLAAGDTTGLEALVIKLREDSDSLAAAVTANTPQVPA